MISVRCPECDSRLEVDDVHLGQDVRCPGCRTVFVARPAGDVQPYGLAKEDDDFDDRPRRRPTRYDDDDDDDYDRPRRRGPEEVVDDARRAVFLPALLSAIACILSLLYHLADAAFIIANPNALKNNPLANLGGGPPPPIEAILAGKAVVLLYAVVALAGAFAMMRLKARPFVMTTLVMQLIPCLGPCCLFTLPLGIWGLIVLNNPDVKDGFELARDQVANRRPAPRRDRDRDRGYDEDEDDDRGRER